MLFASTIIATAAVAVVGVNAHGFVQSVTVNGEKYGTTVFVNSDKYRSTPMFPMDYNNPIKDVYSNDMACGPNARNAHKTVDVGPNSRIDYHWMTHDDMNWIHNKGPAMAYLAKCPNDSCSGFDATQGDWFKVAYDGQRPDGSYVQNDLLEGKSWGFNMPQHLEDGAYLVRHELIALHFSNFKLGTNGGNDGAEFYPMCISVKFKGNGGKNPSETVKFPGAYNPQDKGFYNPHFYDNGYKYPDPAPSVHLPTAGNGGSNNDNDNGGKSDNGGKNDDGGKSDNGGKNDNNNNNSASNDGGKNDHQDTPPANVAPTPDKPKPSKTCKRSNRKKRSSPLVRSADTAGAVRRSRHHLAMEQRRSAGL